MSNQMQNTMQKVPGIGDIPILGYLFRSQAAKRDQTELVVMITPEILPNNSPGVTPNLPSYPDTFLPPLSDLKGTRPAPAPAFTQPARSQAMAPATAPVVVDNRTEIERAQDRALEALDRKNQPQTAAAQLSSTQSDDSNQVSQATADSINVSKEQQDLLKAAHEQADRDAKVADQARKEDAKRSAEEQKKEEKAAREQAKRDAEAAKVQAKKDAEAAKVQARRDAEAAKVQAKRDAEMAKLQAKQDELTAAKQQKPETQAVPQQAADTKGQVSEQERQQALDAAAERLRAAEEEYQAELARRQR
jgi:hypothetical protein